MLLAKKINLIVFSTFVNVICASYYTSVRPMGQFTCFNDTPTAIHNFVTRSQCTFVCNRLDTCRYFSYVDKTGSSSNGSCQLYTFEPRFYALITDCRSYRKLGDVSCSISTADTGFDYMYCDDSYKGPFAGSCYYLSTISDSNAGSYARCRAMGANLASINSQSEMNFVASGDSNVRWFALAKYASTSSSPTYWIDRNPSTYRRWGGSCPNLDASCVTYQNGYFYDHYCAWYYPFTCKKAAVPVLTSSLPLQSATCCSIPFSWNNTVNYQCVDNSKVSSTFKSCPMSTGQWITCQSESARSVSYKNITVDWLNAYGTTISLLIVNDWILIQNKVPLGSNKISFNQSWDSYRNGFGSPSLTDNYWIGNENIYRVTNASRLPYKLRVEIQRQTLNWYSAEYSSFSISDETDSYRLTASGYSGDAGDALCRETYVDLPYWISNGKTFSTVDRISDSNSTSCVTSFKAGWWWNFCATCALNSDNIGSWYDDSRWGTSNVIASRMMIKRVGL